MIDDEFPSLEEFKEHVFDSPSYTEEDLLILSKYAPKAGFKSVAVYLNYIYNRMTDLDHDKVQEHNSKFLKQENLSSGLLITPANLIGNSIIKKKYRKINEAANKKFIKFPEDVKERIRSIEIRFSKSLISLILKKKSSDPKKCNLYVTIWRSIFSQQLTTNPNSLIAKEMVEFIDSLRQPELSQLILNEQKNHFYFANRASQLDKFHDSLAQKKLIISNNNFKYSFSIEIPSGVHITQWTGTQAQSLYFLYLLAGEKIQMDGIRLNRIAFRLFRYKVKKASEKSLNSVFNKLTAQMNDKYYFKNKLRPIKDIFDSLYPSPH